MRPLVSRTLALFRRRRLENELDDDVRLHLELLAADYERGGMTPVDARRAARRDFGGVEQMKEIHRDLRGWRWMQDARQDLRYAARTLARNPGFATTAILTLALGIGANTAFFSVIDALMLRKLPVPQPDALVLFTVADGEGRNNTDFSYPLYEDFRDGGDHFSGVATSMGVTQRQVEVPQAGGEAELINAEGVSGDFFRVLGITPILGRELAPSDDRRGDAQPVAVLSNGFWSRRFGRDASVIGQTITMSAVPFTIVGVAPAGFFGFEVGANPDVWFPLQMLSRMDPGARQLWERTSEWLRVVGRLRDGVTRAAAQAQLTPIYQRNREEDLRRVSSRPGPAMTAAQRDAFLRQSLQLLPGATGETQLRQRYGRPLVILMIVVGLVLLVACANVANLLLARAASRQQEMSVRMAIGAGRRRIVRQLLTESVFLAVVGGGLGLVVAVAVSRVLLSFVPDPATTLRVGLDLRVLAFSAAVSMATGLLFGVIPALSVTRRNLGVSLVAQGRATAGRRRLTLHNMLVVSQVALAVVVLITGGLFLRSLQNLQRLDLGFEQDRLTVFRLLVPGTYDAGRRDEVFRRVVDRLQEVPDAAGVSFSMFGLLSGSNRNVRVDVPGYTPGTSDSTGVQAALVGAGFFAVTGMRVVDGRGFLPEDDRSGRRVAVINRMMATRFFGNQPIGRRFAVMGPSGAEGDPIEIVGIAVDAKYRNLKESVLPTFYLPFAQESAAAPRSFVQVAIRTATDRPLSDIQIRRAVRDVDPASVVTNVRSMGELIDASIAQERLLATLAGLFGVLALTLASIGVYGVRSYAVSSRTNEIGIRMALGATAARTLRVVLGQGLMHAVAGIALGSVAAVTVTRYVDGLLHEVTPRDPATYVAVGMLFGVVAALASYVPARRAARLNPLVALRSE